MKTTTTITLSIITATILTGCGGGGSSSPQTPQVPQTPVPIETPTENPTPAPVETNSDPVANFTTSESASSDSFSTNATPISRSFDASSSYDPDGDALTYSWDVANNTFSLSGKTPMTTQFNRGSSVIKLTVCDTKGACDSISKTIVFSRDSNGYNSNGYDKDGYNDSGYDLNGYNSNGYDKDGFNQQGYNSNGYDKDGYDQQGFDSSGYDKDGYNSNGFNQQGYDKDGFNKDGYDQEGYNYNGYDSSGYNKDGYNSNGFNQEGYDINGYNTQGYNQQGYDINGYDINGYDKDGFNQQGWNTNKIHRDTGTLYDLNDKDIDGNPRPPQKNPSENVGTKYETKSVFPISHSDIHTNEFNTETSYQQINLSAAYEQGYTGEGITVGVIDSGVSKIHTELQGKLVPGKTLVAKTELVGWYKSVTSPASFNEDQVQDIAFSSNEVFDTAPIITIEGDGTGATAKALWDTRENVDKWVRSGDEGYDPALDQSGYGHSISVENPDYHKINSIIVENGGSDYTSARVLINGVEQGKTYIGTEDNLNHGSHVAGTIAAAKDNSGMHGVAYNANIMPIKVISGDNKGSLETMANGVAFGTSQGLKVSNMSLGTKWIWDNQRTADYMGAMKEAMQNDHSLIMSAGNNGLDSLPDANGNLNGRANFPAALPSLAEFSDLRDYDGAWIVVGSVNSNNQLSSFSNKAGVTKNYYMVAPGENINSIRHDNQGYRDLSGTSMATPIVTGSFALLAEKYPYLKGKEIEQILFAGCDDLGEAGVDNVYGHGLLNLATSMAPIGTLTLPVRSTGVSANSTTVEVSSISANSMIASSLKTNFARVALLDDFNRAYTIDMSSTVTETEKFDYNFDKFVQMEIGESGLLVGFDQINQNIALGKNFSSYNFSVLVSKEDGFFNNNLNGIHMDETSTYFTNIKTTLKGFEFGLTYGTASTSGTGLVSEMSGESLSAEINRSFSIDAKQELSLGVVLPTSTKTTMKTSIPKGRINDTIVYEDSTSTSYNRQDLALNVEYNNKITELLTFNLSVNPEVSSFNLTQRF